MHGLPSGGAALRSTVMTRMRSASTASAAILPAWPRARVSEAVSFSVCAPSACDETLSVCRHAASVT